MKELNDIVLAYEKAVMQNKQTALVTVVQVIGSSYRRPGARMLVTEDGEITGAISGGCLEGDALRKAQFAMHQQQNRLEIYDTTNDDENNIGIQLGCNGIVYILFEPIKNEDENNPVNLLRKAAKRGKGSVLITFFNQQKSEKQLGTLHFTNADEIDFLDDLTIRAAAQDVLNQKKSVVKAFEEQSVLYQFVPPAIKLLIVGAGNDVQPLVAMAFILGWDILVVDGRPAYATTKRFPKAGKVILTKPADLLSVVTIDQQTAVVLMTHNYNYDLCALEQLLFTQCHYIGVLGPKKKLHKMFDELNAKGIDINEDTMPKIHGPAGLDIGAETAEEIATSIVAEIQAVFSNRQGAFLKERQVEIHERAR